MPQLHLPLFPSGATEITAALSFCAQDSTVTYFHCGMPVFSHDKNDRASFRLITAQLHVTSGAAQAELAKAFGVSKISIKRAVKLYRSSGAAVKCDAQVDDGVQSEPDWATDWDGAAQPAPDFEVDQRISW